MQSFGYGRLLEPELKNFRDTWRGDGPVPELTRDAFLMTIVWWPQCVDAGPRGDEARRADEALRKQYPDLYKGETPAPVYAAAARFAALYAEFPDFVAGWLNHARQFLNDNSVESIARRWLLTNYTAKRPKFDGSGKQRRVLPKGGAMVSVCKLQLQEICDVIKRDTGKQISVASLRRVRAEIVGLQRTKRDFARIFNAWVKNRPRMQEIPLGDAMRIFRDEIKSEI